MMAWNLCLFLWLWQKSHIRISPPLLFLWRGVHGIGKYCAWKFINYPHSLTHMRMFPRRLRSRHKRSFLLLTVQEKLLWKFNTVISGNAPLLHLIMHSPQSVIPNNENFSIMKNEAKSNIETCSKCLRKQRSFLHNFNLKFLKFN